MFELLAEARDITVEQCMKAPHGSALLTPAQLEKYTNNDRHKRYYEQNKERVKENAKQYLNRLKKENPDKLKEYRHKAYIKRKTEKTNVDAN
jgi:hypothetical protein